MESVIPITINSIPDSTLRGNHRQGVGGQNWHPIFVQLLQSASWSLDQSPPPLPPLFVNVPKGHRGGRGNGAGPEDAHQAKHVVQDHRQHHPHHDAVEQAGGQGEHGVARPHGQGVVDHEAGVEDLS